MPLESDKNADNRNTFRPISAASLAFHVLEFFGQASYRPLSSPGSPLSIDGAEGWVLSVPSPGDTAIQSIHSFDGLGRLILTEKTDPEGTVNIERAYRYSAGFFNELVSRPYRTGSEVTMGWTRTRYDGLGRVVNVSSFGGNTKPAPWVGDFNHRGTTSYSYDGDMTTLQDAVGVQRRTTTDALGRLTEVMEANDAPGTVKYCYDVLDNLVAVHHATQVARDTLCAGQPATRAFSYSSLSRLSSATNPESGTTAFAYDKDGNLLRRNQPGGLVTCLGTWNGSTCSSGYDNLGRPTKKTYSDATPAVTYVYDQATLGKGLLYSVTTPHSETFFPSYNRLGRPTASQQKTLLDASNWSVSDFSYSYFLSGDLKTITYPSGRTITYSVNSARNTTGIISQSKTYMSGAKYWPDGSPDKFLLGTTNTRWQHLCRNDMGQTETVLLRSAEPTTACPAAQSSELFRLDYTHETRFGSSKASDNNGNVRSQRIQRDTTAWNQTFTYDSRNRLETAVETGGWQQAYKYDFHGNRAVIANQTNYFPSNQTFTPSVPSSADSVSAIFPDNRWTGNSYADGRGNVTGIASSTHTFTYDAENRNTQAVIGTGGGAVTVNYAYDGDGRRVRRVQGSQRTIYVYDAFGRLATESGSGGGTATQFLVSDPIGSTRQILNADGTAARCHDYLPFGEEIKQNDFGRGACFGSGVYPNNQDTQRLKFSAKERDPESGLDYFGARYVSGAQGRFTSPDGPLIDQFVDDPQSWNLYSYARNNPLKYVDRTGEAIELVGDEEERKKQLQGLQQAVGSKAGAYLYQNAEKDKNGNLTGRHFVGVLSGGPTGKGPDFGSINNASKALSGVIGDSQIAQVHLVDPGESFTYFSPTNRQTSLNSSTTGLTSPFNEPSPIKLWVLNPAYPYGDLSPGQMANSLPGRRTFPDNLMHELGHAAWQMDVKAGRPTANDAYGNQRAINFENYFRLRLGMGRRSVH